MQDFKRTKLESSYNSQRTEDFSIINGQPSVYKQQEQKITQFDEQASEISEYQENKSTSLKQPLPIIQQNIEKSEYESQIYESIADSQPGSEIKALIEQKKIQDQKPIYLNIMVVGQSGLGKSTFIDVLLKKKLGTGQIIRDSTLQIQEIQGQIYNNDLTLNIKFIDTPGFRHQYGLRSWLKLLCTYIHNQFNTYKTRQTQQYESKEKFQKLSQQDLDERVHVCLYFFSGPRIQAEDLQALKKISGLVNVIPILAKGDSYTKNEIIQLKQQFNDLINEYHIDLFKCQCNNSYQEKSQFGMTPPYVIISSIEQFQVGNHFIYGRKFPWGICDIFNPQHSDLSIIYKLLIGHYCFELINLTEYLYNKYEQKEKEKLKLQQQNQNWLRNLLRFFFNL
ncbi:unnamed protein product [Paramecium pentaurelia]|uniref:Septin-type G domain-containing protein n=1 Tax=Paramecium pentaurelia TaxID=43138 RepID=A0A8S1W323_9CILI|nr:unnamed protein product [Paramecium pentaurelia]